MDKEKIHIDEEFLNQSWANMSAILDKEMPVKKRKRRFVWLWFGSLLAVTLLVITYLSNPFSNKKEIVPINSKKQVEIKKSTPKVADNQLIDLKKESTQKSQISSSTKSTDTPSSVNTINTIKNLTLASTSESTKSIVDSEAGNLEGRSQLPNETEILINQQNNKAEINKEHKAAVKIENTIPNRQSLAEFSPIPSLKFSPDYDQDISLNFPTYPVKIKGSWHFGLYAGKTYPKFGSFRTGIHAQKAINRKWSIYFGLGYARRVAKVVSNQDQSLNADATANQLPENSMEEDTMAGASSPSQQDPLGTTFDPEFTATSFISFQNFHYFELPFMVQYQINRRWSLELGGQVSRLYGYRYTSSADGSSAFTSDVSFSSFEMERSSVTNYSEIAAWDFAALGGVAFQLNPHLQIYSNYRLGLNNYLTHPTDDANHKKWRQIELGVRYYFK